MKTAAVCQISRNLPHHVRLTISVGSDLAMTDPKSLDPETSSLALIGRFLKRVCDLEEKLNEAIAGTLKIDDTKRVRKHPLSRKNSHSSLFRPQFRFD
jgi:hypothetical protein